MPRRARIDLEGYYYHIIARGQRKNPLFFSDKDYAYFLKLINEYSKKHDLEIFAFCLMKNHYHLLVKRNKDSLKDFFLNLHTKYAIYFNNKYKTVGHVFQGRYKSFIILNEKYIYTLIDYIHNNPVKTQLVKNIKDYKYSSYNFYNNKNSLIKNIKKYTSSIYINNIEKYINKDKNFIGDKNDYLHIPKRIKGREKGISVEKRHKKNMIEKDFKKICNEKNIDISIKFGRFLRGKRREIQNMIISELFEMGYSKAEVARFFNTHKSTISRKLKEYEERK